MDAGIPYSANEINDGNNVYDPNQGERIIPKNITETDAKMFFRMFWGLSSSVMLFIKNS